MHHEYSGKKKMDNQQKDNGNIPRDEQEGFEGLKRPMTPEQYAKEIRNVYLAVGLVGFVFVLIVLGVLVSWV